MQVLAPFRPSAGTFEYEIVLEIERGVHPLERETAAERRPVTSAYCVIGWCVAKSGACTLKASNNKAQGHSAATLPIQARELFSHIAFGAQPFT
jgi:hypothetical protein